MSFMSDISFADFTRQNIFKFSVKREKRQELFFPVLELNTLLLVSMPPASAFRCSLADLKAKQTNLLIQPNLLCHSSQLRSSLKTTSAASASASFTEAVSILMRKVLE